jgi:hypothetical protein
LEITLIDWLIDWEYDANGRSYMIN